MGFAEFAEWFGAFINPESRTLGNPIRALIAQAKLFGLPEKDILNALSMIEYAEYECAFDIIIQQLYQYDVSINNEYFQLIDVIAKRLNLPKKSYIFVKKLIK